MLIGLGLCVYSSVVFIFVLSCLPIVLCVCLSVYCVRLMRSKKDSSSSRSRILMLDWLAIVSGVCVCGWFVGMGSAVIESSM